MPPKILSSSSKVGTTPLFLNNKAPKPFIPSGPIELSVKKPNILGETDVQETITISRKEKFLADAYNQEEKLPRFSIEKVEFKILTPEILDKLKIVNVSTKINRTPDLGEDELISTNQYSRAAKDPSCYKTVTGDTYAFMLKSEQSVTSYPQMGTVESDKLCQTCQKTDIDCPGHLGEIKLNHNFVHPFFRDYLIMVLTSVCNSCSKLLLSKDYIVQQNFINLKGKNRLKHIATVAEKKRRCDNPKCNKINPKYVTRKPASDSFDILYSYPKISKMMDSKENIRDISEIEMILKGVSQEDAELMGFMNGTHPKDMIMKSFAVIPPSARPYIFRDGEVNQDHLTTAYDEIIRDNYRYAVSDDENKRQKISKDLYFHISHFIDNSDQKYCRSPTEKIKSIKERITKKDGLIRSCIMGKRVNFCGRSVIGPDASLKFGEIGIPEEMCQILTVPEVIHEKNYEYILDLWNRRQITHIIFNGQRKVVLEKDYGKTINGKPFTLKIGHTVERRIDDGDLVVVNRQPTLYKYGMPGNFVKKIPRKNIGIHMSETSMRNADFDGDEINIHVIQTLDARVEAMTFANVQSCIPNALINSAMIGMLYNALTSAYIMTRSPNKDPAVLQRIQEGYYTPEEVRSLTQEITLTEEEIREAHNVLTYKKDLSTLNERLKKHNINPRSGRALFSSLLPATFYYSNKDVVIKDGVLVSGRISKSNLKSGSNVIQISIWKWYGKDRAVSFITDCVFLTDWFILNHGFSIGFEDINPVKKVKGKIDEIIIKNLNETNQKINKLGKIKPDMTKIEKEYHENQICGYLQDFTSAVSNLEKEALSPENPLNVMADSGAKGNKTYTTNIIGLKGQEMVNKRRPAMKISDGKRCLPYFAYDSASIEARGFVQNSFVKGLTPAEMYFISEGAREGSISTATSTAQSGSLAHKLVKCLEDCKVCYDGSVRNASNAIFQMSYFDGYDAGELINVSSHSAGDLVSFINLREAANRINAEFM